MKFLQSIASVLVLGTAVVSAGTQFYTPDSNVQEISASKFDKVVKKTNYTSIVEFYAPWCGYCQKLAPTYRKVAKSLSNYAVNVVAVNCDENRELCASYQIEGYPTLMVFRPAKFDKHSKSTRNEPALETYLQKRDAKSIHDFVVGRIKNYVKRLPAPDTTDYTKWLSLDKKDDKFVLISKAKAPSPMLKTLAIDFLALARFGHNPSKSDTVTINEIEYTLPVFVHYKNDDATVFDGKLNDRIAISKWITSISGAKPAEGPLAKKSKKSTKSKKAKPARDEL